MLSYEKRLELALKALDDYVTDEPKEAAENDEMYLVKDAGEVIAAYAADLEKIEGVYDNSFSEDIERAMREAYNEDFEVFFARHGIEWK